MKINYPSKGMDLRSKEVKKARLILMEVGLDTDKALDEIKQLSENNILNLDLDKVENAIKQLIEFNQIKQKQMSKIIAASIDLTKIDRTRIVTGKNGAEYYNITVIINDQKDQYGNDASIQEGQTKEEREAKSLKKYIGNGKLIYSS